MIVTVTFHCADNYGAVWQAFALQSYIKSAFPKQDVACLDYKPKYLQAKLFHFDNNESLIKSLAKNVLTLPSRLERILRFRKFRKKNINTVPFESLGTIDAFDTLFIVGSDQVWNKKITNNRLDPIFFLENIQKGMKCSYAASVGNDDGDSIVEIANRLTNFSYIGIREFKVVQELKKNGFSNVLWNVDPVFLLDKNDYLMLLPKVNSDKYILIYTLETNEAIRGIVKNYGKEYRTISIGSFKNIYSTDRHYSCASPEMFLSLIANASLVVSNSFHTLAFSIIFDKDFLYVPLKNGRGSRIENLLRILNVDGNMCRNTSSKKTELMKQIISSKQYLSDIITL